MNTCGLTRLLLAAFAIGFTTTSVTGSEPQGWIAAALTVLAIVVARRIRGTTPSCHRRHAIAESSEDHRERQEDLDLDFRAVETVEAPATGSGPAEGRW